MNTTDFYKSIKILKNFHEITNNKNYEIMPDDWYVLVTDIKGSTKAIEEGRYKEVNFVGAMSIVSILNLSRDIDIPFVFGGDGATMLIPPVLYEKASLALVGLKNVAKEQYGFELRVGIIAVKDIYRDKKEIQITKFEVSKDYIQAVIRGGGIEYAEYLLKNSYEKYKVKKDLSENNSVDFTGLECRWESIPSPKDETISLLIKANSEQTDKIYEEILENIEKIIGNANQRHPIKIENLKLSFNPKKLNVEASLYAKTIFQKFFLISKILLINIIGKFLMSFKINKWGEYKEHISQTTDTEKFDDMLRMIVATDKAESKLLEEYLEKEYKIGKIVYGLHRSDSALMTCLIFERHGKHVHFVDGSDGGYALAAKKLKNRAKKALLLE